jgi:hypothetical protein
MRACLSVAFLRHLYLKHHIQCLDLTAIGVFEILYDSVL